VAWDNPDVSHPLAQRLLDFEFPERHWALFGSGPLLLRGWIAEIGDVDVFARGPALEIAEKLGAAEPIGDAGNELIRIGKDVTVMKTWPFGPAGLDTMIETAETIEGIPCVRLEYLVAYMEMFDRPKDRDRLAVIEAHT
jgi:hypothetical protein